MATVAYVEYPPAQLKLPVRFTAKAGKFTCIFGSVKYEDVSLDPLKAKVLKAIVRAYMLEWSPVLTLLFRNHGDVQDSRESTSLYLVRERKYVGSHKDTDYRQVSWETEPEKRLAASRTFHWEGIFSLPTQRESSEGLTIYLPYTEDTWTTLQEIQQYLSITHARIRQHITSPEAIHTLLAASRRLYDHAATAQDNED